MKREPLENTLAALTQGSGGVIQTGPFGSQLHVSDYRGAGVPVVMPTNIADGRICDTSIVRIDEDKATELARHRLKKGDLVFSRRGEVDKCAMIDDREIGWLCGTGCLLVRVNPESADSRYLMYHINSYATGRWLKQNSVGLVMPNLNTGILERIPIHVPHLTTQRKIADLLARLDVKILLNSQKAETIQGIARALFQNWFVDFDPVRRAAAGVNTRLPAHIAALFPKRLTDDGLPEGWTATPLPKMATFLNGLALQCFPPTDDVPSLPVIKIAEMRTGTKVKTARATSALPSKDYIVEDGDHLFSWSGSLMHCLWSHGSGALNQHLFKVIPTSAPAWLCYQAVDHFLPEFQRIASGKAVTMGHIQRHHLDRAIVAMPPTELLARVGEVINPMFERMKSLAGESRTLTTLRDTLLPKLISGELRIRDAEKIAESA